MLKTVWEDLSCLVYGCRAEDDELRENFLKAQQALSLAFLLVKHIDACRKHADEVIAERMKMRTERSGLPGPRPAARRSA